MLISVFIFFQLGILKGVLAKTVLGKDFTAKITPPMNDTWYRTRGEGVQTSLKRFLLVYIGEPLNKLIRYA